LPSTTTQRIAFDVADWRNPVGVARIVAAIPKVAEYSNLDGYEAARGASWLAFWAKISNINLRFGL